MAHLFIGVMLKISVQQPVSRFMGLRMGFPLSDGFLASAILCNWLVIDFSLLYRLSSGRSESFIRFQKADYAFLEGRTGVAWDVGMVGYFTAGTILDPNGLVNGREFAKMQRKARLEAIAAEKIDFAFVNDSQLRSLSEYVDVSTWATIDQFDFPNVKGGRDTHYLLVRPGLFGDR